MPSYTECLIEASKTIIGKICDAAEMEEGKSVFQYFLPQKVDVCRVSISGGNQASLAGCAVSSLIMDSPIEGRFASVEAAQRFALQICSIFPVRNEGVIESFHLTAPPSFEARTDTIGNSAKPALFYHVTLPCQVAFTVADG